MYIHRLRRCSQIQDTPIRRRWSLLWWLPPVILGISGGIIPEYSPARTSDRIEGLLLDLAFIYIVSFIVVRMFYAARRRIHNSEGHDPQRGFEVIINRQNSEMQANPETTAVPPSAPLIKDER